MGQTLNWDAIAFYYTSEGNVAYGSVFFSLNYLRKMCDGRPETL